MCQSSTFSNFPIVGFAHSTMTGNCMRCNNGSVNTDFNYSIRYKFYCSNETNMLKWPFIYHFVRASQVIIGGQFSCTFGIFRTFDSLSTPIPTILILIFIFLDKCKVFGEIFFLVHLFDTMFGSRKYYKYSPQLYYYMRGYWP